MKRILILLVALMCIAAVSCEKGPAGSALGLARDEVTVGRGGGSVLISADADFDFGALNVLEGGEWRMTVAQGGGKNGIRCGWMRAVKFVNGAQANFIQIEVSPNRTGSPRTCIIGVTDGNMEETVTVNQK